ncbi:hypothetical protein FOZ63_026351 [Perkinsus olseni]|uniref:Uncharacterized protein n=1 Tax=Perkinsus olseni TaxID=32597 RepID=A0A7J6QMB2_PEROL|nr:hypothetical protein FOZ62_006879 [Perkinsus olseni]KAF4709271.1 hypothetical protein FOZ63_026351 [Perkinsus olseni]
MVERVWKESTVVGPLPELMCDIMAYIPKPALTLDCPMEEIIIKDKPDFFFIDDGIVYGVFNQLGLISLVQMSHPALPIPLVKYTGSSSCYYSATYHYDAETSHFYILHDAGGSSRNCSAVRGTSSLIDYDVKASKVHKTLRLPNLSGEGHFPRSMALIDSSIFLGLEWGHNSGDTTRCIEVLRADPSGKVNVVWRISDKNIKLLCLHPVSTSPLTLDIIYSEGSTCHSARLELRRLAAPIVVNEGPKRHMSMSQNAGPFGGGLVMVRNTPSISIFDSRLRPVWVDLRLPEDPTCLSIRTDRYGGIYFLIERLIEGYSRYRVLSAFPYFN